MPVYQLDFGEACKTVPSLGRSFDLEALSCASALKAAIAYCDEHARGGELQAIFLFEISLNLLIPSSATIASLLLRRPQGEREASDTIGM